MRIFKMADMKGGWFVGNFEPSVYRTQEFEACFKKHFKDEKWDSHYHKEAIEINYLIHGKMKINDIYLSEGDIFIIDKEEVAAPVFLEDCELIVIKTPSVIGDKYITNSIGVNNE